MEKNGFHAQHSSSVVLLRYDNTYIYTHTYIRFSNISQCKRNPLMWTRRMLADWLSEEEAPLLPLNNNSIEALQKPNLACNGLMERVRRLHVKIAHSRQYWPVCSQFKMIIHQMCCSSHVASLWSKLWKNYSLFKTTFKAFFFLGLFCWLWFWTDLSSWQAV